MRGRYAEIACPPLSELSTDPASECKPCRSTADGGASRDNRIEKNSGKNNTHNDDLADSDVAQRRAKAPAVLYRWKETECLDLWDEGIGHYQRRYLWSYRMRLQPPAPSAARTTAASALPEPEPEPQPVHKVSS